MIEETSPPEIIYQLKLADPGRHLLEIVCRIDRPDPDGQVFSLPAWIPGSYLIRDYARHVLSVEATTDSGPLGVRKLDKSTWMADPADGPVVIKSEVYAHDLSVRGAYLDHGHAFVNGVCAFFRVHGQDNARCVVHVDPPERPPMAQWQLATALQRLSGPDLGFGAFEAEDYEALIDRPLLMGPLTVKTFEIDGVEHRLVLVGRFDADLDRMVADMQRICACHATFFGGLPPMDRYEFLVTVLNHGHGGLEHRDCCALICSRKELPRPGVAKVTDGYRKFLGLVSHEYFHLWNVKRIRPAEFVPYRLGRESYTRQLWLFEGVTSYYDDLALLRSGLITVDSYLELLARTLTRVYRSGGRRRQTLEESSFDAWIKLYRPDENTPNAVVSYYAKGAMVALALDLELRLRTDGRISLDDVMQVLWQEYGHAAHGLPEGGFERLAAEVSGLDLDDFFRHGLRTTLDPPAGILLAQFGVSLHLRAAESARDGGGRPGRREQRPRPWLGLDTRDRSGRVEVRHVLAAGPAADAGVSAGDELVAIDGIRVTPSSLTELLDELEIGTSVPLQLFRRDELMEIHVQVMRPPRDTVWLSLIEDADPDSLQRRQQWLGT